MNKVQERLKVAIHDVALSYLSWGHERLGEEFAHILREFIAKDGNLEISIRQLFIEMTNFNDEAWDKLEWEIISHFERRGFSVDISTDPAEDGEGSVCSIWIGTPKTVYLTLTH